MSHADEEQSRESQPVPQAAHNPPGVVRRLRRARKGASEPPRRWATTILGRMVRRIGAVALAFAAVICAIAAYQSVRSLIGMVTVPGGVHWGTALALAAMAAGLAIASFRLMPWSAGIELKLNVPGG